MFTFLLVVHALIAAILVAVILMQRSEGGGLGMGGSPSGLMSARGAADFLTRATTILASLFVILSIALAVIATRRTSPSTIDTSLARTAPAAPLPSSVPMQGEPLAAAAAGNVAVPAPAPVTATTPAPRSAPTRTPKPAREIAPPPVVAT
ncbi:MAG: preprotein translocase subunit SecG, partial [Sphingomonadaceae bacterium]|nr:preprotein translocase subunit SecG [Sphingomonadaceae bacterium]